MMVQAAQPCSTPIDIPRSICEGITRTILPAATDLISGALLLTLLNLIFGSHLPGWLLTALSTLLLFINACISRVLVGMILLLFDALRTPQRSNTA